MIRIYAENVNNKANRYIPIRWCLLFESVWAEDGTGCHKDMGKDSYQFIIS